jgi:serine/threonine-protein kinase RsbW
MNSFLSFPTGLPLSRRSRVDRAWDDRVRRPLEQSDLVLRNDMSELERMTEWILGVCKRAELSEKAAFALQLCLEEVVTNIIRHGEASARATEIVTSVVRDGADIIMTIEDDGGPFDPTKFVARPRARSLEEASVGGLGISLMRHFARHIEYGRSGGRNHLRLTISGA